MSSQDIQYFLGNLEDFIRENIGISSMLMNVFYVDEEANGKSASIDDLE